MTQFKVDFNDFKRRDNTNLMEITLYKDNGETITPNRDHQWSGKALKFGDGDKRLDQELAVTLDGDKIGVPSKQLETLPSGDYGLELWEVNNDSKTIYPSAGFIEFHIHRNADESLESVTPTTNLDKIIDDLHTAGLNVVVDGIEMLAPDATPSVTSEVRDGKNHIKLHIPRGLKGDQGPAPTLKIGTVTKLNSDQTPTASISGDNGAYTLDLGIPQGPQGPVDQSSVKKSGDVMTGSLKAPQVIATDLLTGFHEVIQIPSNTTKIIDLINNNFLQGKDSWKEATFAAYNNALSDAPTNDLYSVIKLVTRGTGRTYVEYYDLSGNLWHTTAVGGTLAPWVKQANDANVVHNTSNETIAGDKAFVGNTTLATTKILAGNYGLRVTSSGFEKTTDGITWVPANI